MYLYRYLGVKRKKRKSTLTHPLHPTPKTLRGAARRQYAKCAQARRQEETKSWI
jgi:hypothetical protein